MEPVVTIIDNPRKACGIQTVSVCRRSQNRACWKDIATVNLKTAIFRQPGQGQGSLPKTAEGFFDGMSNIFVGQAVVCVGQIELRAIRLRLTKANSGFPDTPIVSDIKPFILDVQAKNGEKRASHTDTLSLAIDHEKARLFALYSSLGSVRLFCHLFGSDEKDKTLVREWMELALPALFQPCTLVKDALLFSASHMSTASCSLSSRSMIDLRECSEQSFPLYGPYTIEMDAMAPVEIRVMDGPGMPLNDLKDLSFSPVDKMYFSPDASGPVLISGQSYTIDLTLGGRVWAYDSKNKRKELPTHSGNGKTHSILVPRLQTDRMRLGEAKNLEFSVQGSDILGLKINAAEYIIVDHVVSGTNRISAVKHGVRENIVFLSRSDPLRDHAMDMPHQFAQSGDILDIDLINGQVYVHTRRTGDRYSLHQLWHVVGNMVELTSCLTTETNAFVFAEHHAVNPFNSSPSPAVCLCTLFNEGRLFTCCCAGPVAETNRSADAFTGKKGYMRGNWDLYYMRGSPDPIVEDAAVKACIVY